MNLVQHTLAVAVCRWINMVGGTEQKDKEQYMFVIVQTSSGARSVPRR